MRGNVNVFTHADDHACAGPGLHGLAGAGIGIPAAEYRLAGRILEYIESNRH